MLDLIRIDFLLSDRKIKLPTIITPGNPFSAFLIGSTFAIGWTPCVGPVLASILLLASTQATAWTGGILLAIFSFGLAIPFLLTATLYTKTSHIITKYNWVASSITRVGGIFLIILGLFLFFDNFGLLLEYGYKMYEILNITSIFNYF